MIHITDFIEQHLLTCQIKSQFGFDCPGCGMQRALVALLRGNLKESLFYNASLMPFIGTFLFAISHLYFSFKNGAKFIIIFFSLTVAIMILQFAAKLVLQQTI